MRSICDICKKRNGKKCLVILEHELKDNIDIVKQKIEEYMKI